MWFGLLWLLLELLEPSCCFNVDTRSSVIQERPRGSCQQDCMFGFSVAQHSEQGIPWVLVGAPRADSGQPGVQKGGAVYKCPALQTGGCQIIPFDKGGDTLTPAGKQFDEKSGQWFGAVVRSSGADGTVLACAHRYIYYVFMFRLDPVGVCYVARNNFTKISQYRPCVETGKWGYHRQGSCQAGLGAAVSKNGKQIYIGAVGSWYWQGQVYSISTDQGGNSSMGSANAGQFSANTKMLRNQRKTEEGNPQDDDSYLGYSVTTGDFNGDGDNMDVAVGMPRGSNLTGKVVLYNSNLTNLNNLTGTQIGAYFGYSLASADLNGDGLDDIIIGAPMWTNYAEMGKFETGRVYVVYQNKHHRFRDYDTLDGKNHKARFGLSVASLGDINLDGSGSGKNSLATGYHDIAVGAPYDGPEQRGAVYIYLGSAEGVMKEPSQVIFARDLSTSLKTFGWSLSGGMDMDQNKYPDLLVGAYDSGHAVHMRAAPVVHMTAEISFERASKQIDLDNAACTLKDRKTRVPCVPVTVSLRYTGIGVPNKLEYELEYVLDSKKEKQKRMYFIDDEGVSVRTSKIEMLKERVFKDRMKVYLAGPNIKDKLTSLEVQVRYSLADSAGTGVELTPVLGLGDHMASDSINIQKECGPDNICVPDLSISTREISSYLMGSGEKLEIQTDIVNRGEDAFNAVLEMQVPRGLSYVNANTGDTGVSILCSPPNPRNNNTLQCEVGNPLRTGAQVSASIILQPMIEGIHEPISEFSFALFARSSNPEGGSDDKDNVATFSVPIRVETDFRVTGLSTPPQVTYNISSPLPDRYEFEDDIGEMVTHVYDVKNKGPSAIEEAEVYILWPSFNGYGDHLLYLLGFEYDNAKARCESVKNLNPLSLKTIGSKGYLSAAQSGGAYFRESSQSETVLKQETVENRFESQQRSEIKHQETEEEEEAEGGAAVANQYGSGYSNSYQYNSQQRTFGVLPPSVADGAEETRLFDTQGNSLEDIKSLEGSMNKNNQFSSGSVYQSNTYQAETKSGSQSSGGNIVYSGWRMLPNGTYIRVYDKSSVQQGGVSIEQSGGASSSQGGASGSWGTSSSGGANYNYDAASENKRLAGGSTSSSSSFESSSSSKSSSSNTSPGSDDKWIRLPDGTWSRQSSFSSSESQSSGSQSSGGSYNGGATSTQLGGNDNSGNLGMIMNAAKGPGDYHGTMSKSELEREAGGAIFSANAGSETKHQVSNTQYQGSGGTAGLNSAGSRVESNAGSSYSGEGEDYVTTARGRWIWSEEGKKWVWEEGNGAKDTGETSSDSGSNDSGWTILPNGEYVRKASSWSSQSKSSSGNNGYGVSGGNTGSNSYSGSAENTGSNSYTGSSGNTRINSYAGSAGNTGSNSYTGSSGNTGSSGYRGSNSYTGSSGNAESNSYAGSNSNAGSNSYGASHTDRHSGSNQGYFESGTLGGYNTGGDQNAGGSDSGWILLANGTYVRRQSTWSSSSDSSISSGVGAGAILPKDDEFGDDGKNSTGWIRRPDGTMVKNQSSWASWSYSSSKELDDNHLQTVQRQLEERVKNNINTLPGNVEPGFERQYHRTHRSSESRRKRSLAEFESELSECTPGKCTIIKCTMGPLEKGEGVLFKVRSRLFTETQIKNYAEKVQISSKLLTRVTKLPFFVEEEMLAFQSQTVTTTVIPSEPGEAGTPWWVWLLAALLGILLLSAITYCLYKCGFFKRRRPDDSPEAEPLNGRNGY